MRLFACNIGKLGRLHLTSRDSWLNNRVYGEQKDAVEAIPEADVNLLVVDASRSMNREHKQVLYDLVKTAARCGTPTSVILNKVYIIFSSLIAWNTNLASFKRAVVAVRTYITVWFSRRSVAFCLLLGPAPGIYVRIHIPGHIQTYVNKYKL